MATIYDIAKASGVSATTVSHVLNRTRYVSPEITERVMAAVDELGYEPLRRRNRGEGEISCIRLANAYKIPKINVIDYVLKRPCGQTRVSA